MNKIIEVKNLTKKYGDFTAVDDISFFVESQEIFGILGPNGAGKTTTLEMIEGLRKIDSGEVTVAGINVSEDINKVKSMIGVQLQASSFFEYLTLEELLIFFGNLYEREVNSDELLKEVELLDKKKSYINTLSGGQKQRFSIASALVNDPKALFLDEPITGLDPQARRHLWELIKQIRKKGKTVIITTHYMDEAEVLCDRVAIMDQGKIISLDTPLKLIQELLGKGFEKKVIEQKANLEDVFLDLTGHGLRES
ncbi:ABC transporter ATP-binding protein [bacterium CG_4_10_14_0_2_um_filter_33_32]|nr:MAG: ABC transporter ATP-binding protein [bacterium CG2_30_33_46]PIR67834.1 MAG: ABC transporter ATP-binding protein [bacterium CG10_big_fil_rev_8_21_14_0_10_33_18]PIU76480.1 MAG: ABC transporter ATP-binding protein [bacterium CG06_land_8_20_14_3_00_33_50]PIW81355.1 MAG: ABC transporter ATP-binding protein [bacterium CG_4_8_14_3_um_filter_33_28]PIY85184.1 MAG: ABC transporter ATP-binding protein [bacterium CG_4_10_14_0_8_um_filter_33_57]PIZ86308.1 MAG: ABC transporter ATP-binding protein [b